MALVGLKEGEAYSKVGKAKMNKVSIHRVVAVCRSTSPFLSNFLANEEGGEGEEEGANRDLFQGALDIVRRLVGSHKEDSSSCSCLCSYRHVPYSVIPKEIYLFLLPCTGPNHVYRPS